MIERATRKYSNIISLQAEMRQKPPSRPNKQQHKPSGSHGGYRDALKHWKPPRHGCPICKGPHWVQECLTATTKLKTEAVKALRERKGSQSEHVRRITVNDGLGSSIRTAAINGVLELHFCLDSHEEEARADLGSGEPASLEIRSPTKHLNQDRSADWQSFGRSSTDRTEEGPSTDLEEKPLPPPQFPSGAPADFDSRRDRQDENPSRKPTNARLKSARSKALRKQITPLGSDADDQDDLKSAWSDELLEIAYPKKELHTFLINNPNISDLNGPVQKPTARSSKLEAAKALLQLIKEVGIVAGSFDANKLCDTRLTTINTALTSLFDLLKPLVSEKSARPKQGLVVVRISSY
ncbi:Hypothetical protein PHPALM_15487 [Phytophthora palmivora]|uniref:Uncharacterized protein n=1 Tax=Phytophthora palmivora TaxID=4796 RepID=A0A2P4XS25_9STRA|nr:Hypothetical protein PHPALM_15487 [Phytophthora palmivora]